jgi:hypothetical protein
MSEMVTCEEHARHAAAAQAQLTRPSAAEAPLRKCVSTWRAYNDRRWRFEKDLLPEDARAPFVCECTSEDCLRAVELTMLEFEAAHMSPSWTAVIPGHTVGGDGSRLLMKHPHFWVVELYPVFDRNHV